MNYYLLIYEAEDYVSRRAPYRAEHLALAKQAVARGELRLGGAYGDSPGELPDGGILVFRGADDSTARAFAQADPYVREGVVSRWHVRPWLVAVGVDFLPDDPA